MVEAGEEAGAGEGAGAWSGTEAGGETGEGAGTETLSQQVIINGRGTKYIVVKFSSRKEILSSSFRALIEFVHCTKLVTRDACLPQAGNKEGISKKILDKNYKL